MGINGLFETDRLIAGLIWHALAPASTHRDDPTGLLDDASDVAGAGMSARVIGLPATTCCDSNGGRSKPAQLYPAFLHRFIIVMILNFGIFLCIWWFVVLLIVVVLGYFFGCFSGVF